MKKLSFYTIILYCLATACTLSLNSCQEFNIDSQTEYPPLLETDAQEEYSILAESPRTIVFNISSNTPWRIKSDKSWCIPTPAMSSASSLVAEISVNIEEYADEQSNRTATLTITADGVEGNKEIKITQASKGALIVTSFAEDFPSAGSTGTFSIKANKAWKIINTAGWLSLNVEEGTGTGEKVIIEATTLPNTGLKRSTTLTITSNGKEEQIVVIQKGGVTLEFGDMTPEDLIFDGGMDKESKNYLVIAEAVDYEVTSDAAWLKVEKDEDNNIKAISQSEIYFTNRKANIILTPKGNASGIDPVIMEVEQVGGAYILDAQEEDVIVDEATGAITFTENTGNSNCRYYVNKERKLAIHEWHFSTLNVDENRCLNMNCVAPPKPSWNFWLGVGANPWTFKYRGGTLNDNSTCTPFDMNQLRALKVEHNYVNENAKTEANIKVFIKLEGDTEWINIITTPTYENLFETLGLDGNIPYFGFINGSGGKKGTMTITSYEVTNIE